METDHGHIFKSGSKSIPGRRRHPGWRPAPCRRHLAAAKKATGGQVSGELLQSQEIATLPHTDMATAGEELRFAPGLARIAAEHGLAIPRRHHPTAAWREMQQSYSERYDTVMTICR
jgi:hypothetical protein